MALHQHAVTKKQAVSLQSVHYTNSSTVYKKKIKPSLDTRCSTCFYTSTAYALYCGWTKLWNITLHFQWSSKTCSAVRVKVKRNEPATMRISSEKNSESLLECNKTAFNVFYKCIRLRKRIRKRLTVTFDRILHSFPMSSSLSTRLVSPSRPINRGFVYLNVDTHWAVDWIVSGYGIFMQSIRTHELCKDTTKDFRVEWKSIRKLNVRLMRVAARPIRNNNTWSVSHRIAIRSPPPSHTCIVARKI
jgi:hypothetical protein